MSDKSGGTAVLAAGCSGSGLSINRVTFTLLPSMRAVVVVDGGLATLPGKNMHSVLLRVPSVPTWAINPNLRMCAMMHLRPFSVELN